MIMIITRVGMIMFTMMTIENDNEYDNTSNSKIVIT